MTSKIGSPLEPIRGGFLRPFGAAQFILDFLKGEGPFQSSRIDPRVGSTQTDIHGEYKRALHRQYAEDAVGRVSERRAKEGKPPLADEDLDRLLQFYLSRIPYKLTKMRYHSFVVYFGTLKRLGWVVKTRHTETSSVQGSYPAAPARVYYRISASGRRAGSVAVSDPVTALYKYPRNVRSSRRNKYIRLPH